jgi:hypothetical protein
LANCCRMLLLARYEYTLMSTPDENGHTFFETIVDGVKPIVAVLQAPGALTVKMGETTMTLPEKGRVEAADKFVKGCKVK